MVKEGLYYAKSHEWVKIEGEEAYIGISAHAAKELGEIVFVELPDEGDEITAGESFGSVEAVKAVEDINAPISGEVIEINEDLEDDPGLVNKEPFEGGWMLKIKVSDLSEKDSLMDAAAYKEFIEE